MLIELSDFYSKYPLVLIVVIAFLLIGLAYFIMRHAVLSRHLAELNERNKLLTTNDALLQQKLSQLEQSYADINEQFELLKQERDQQAQQLVTCKIELGEVNQKLSSAQSQLALSQQAVNDEKAHIAQLQTDKQQLSTELASLQTAFSKEKQHSDEKLDALEKNKQQLKKEFEHLANDILKNTQQEFKQQSLTDMGLFLKPFKQQVNDFKTKVEEIHSNDLKQRAELKSELVNLQELNKDITTKAEELTTALKGQKKTQGNWGELILENILDRSGLIDGKDFKRQQNFNTEGGRQLPDVVVYLPDDKHLVVDSKVSLNAYTRYVNSDDEVERQLAIKEHVAAVGARIKELSDKNYFQLPGLNSPEMVFMFIPIESAFVEAVKAEESLFQQAIDQKILIATPTTLLTSLNIVRQLWRFEDQNKHSALLATQAGKIFSKLASILEGLDKLGTQLEKSKETWDNTMKQFVNGKGNLVKQVKDFEKMGVSVQKELPQKWLEQSELEMDADSK